MGPTHWVPSDIKIMRSQTFSPMKTIQLKRKYLLISRKAIEVISAFLKVVAKVKADNKIKSQFAAATFTHAQV